MKSPHIILLVLFVLIFASCSTSHVTAPGHPSDVPTISSLPVWVSESSLDGSEGMGLMGVFSLSIDGETLKGEITSLRQGALTDTLEVVDITNFLTLAPCTDCVDLKSVALDMDNNIVATIGIRHPFPKGDPLKPITGRNRADLHVFNVEGIVISNASTNSFPSSGESIAGFDLVNASGYTGYLDGALDEIYQTAATIHPYVLHFDDYSIGNFDPAFPTGFMSVTDPGPSGNLVMPMGCDYSYKDYVFNFQGSVDFIFAVGCTYAVSSASKSQRFNPEYRIPQHNKKAASEISVEIITNNLGGGNQTSTAELEVHVVDINHNVPVGDALNEMKSDSSVGSISIEIPGVTLSPVNIDGGSPISGTGHDPSDPLVYAATVQNSAAGGMGTYKGLVKVIDTYQPGLNESPLLSGMDGIKRVDPVANPLTGLFVIDEFCTYQVFEIEVFTGNELPICDLQVAPNQVGQGGVVTANPGSSSDPDGTIISYEYDSNYDGTTFTADETQLVGDPDFGDPVTLTMPCNPTGNNITAVVALRVCDDATPSGCTICTENVTVTPKLGDAGNIRVVAINRGESIPNQYLITSIELDWNDNPCGVAEYAVERADGWTGTGWTVVGTSTTSDYKYQLSGMDWDDDMRFRVITRAVVGGDPLTDSDPSEEVFLLFVSHAGTNAGNGWNFNTESVPGVFYLGTWWGPGANRDDWPSPTFGGALGLCCHGQINPPASVNKWSVDCTPQPVPDLEGQNEAFFECYYCSNTDWQAGSQGFCFGTVSDPNPIRTNPTCFDFDPTNRVRGTGLPYNAPNVEGLNNEFGETDQAGFNYLGPSGGPWSYISFYLDDLLEDDRDYPASGLAVGSIGLQLWCTVGWGDAWVFVVH